MRTHQRLLVGLVVLGFGVTASTVQAQKDKDTNSAKLVGKWVIADAKAPQKISLDLMEDGKLHVIVETEAFTPGSKKVIKKEMYDGTFAVEGKKLTLITKAGGQDVKRIFSVKTLTDQMLVIEDERAKMEFRRQYSPGN